MNGHGITRSAITTVLIIFIGFLVNGRHVLAQHSKLLYDSLFESLAVDAYGKLQPCMGNCYGNDGSKCQLNWNERDQGTKCLQLHKLVPKYHTVYDNYDTTHDCMSNCDKFGGTSYEWCVTKWTRFECVKRYATNVTRHVRTRTGYSHCKGECKDGWCNQVTSSWDYCKPNDIVYVTNAPTENGGTCKTVCGAWSTDIYKCYDQGDKWVNCYPSPNANIILTHLSSFAYRRRGRITEDGRYETCASAALELSSTIRKRELTDDDSRDTGRIDYIFHTSDSIEEIATQLEDLFTVETLRWPPPNVAEDPSTDPLIQYTVRVLPTGFNDVQFVAPMVVRARYTVHTRANLLRGNYDEEAYRMLDPLLGDHHGHIIPHQLGGTEDRHNVVPQAGSLNNGRDSHWTRLERTMASYVQTFPRGSIDHLVVLQYDFTVSNRPTSYGVRVRFYDEFMNLVTPEGRRIHTFDENDFENMFFYNEPDPCRPRPNRQ